MDNDFIIEFINIARKENLLSLSDKFSFSNNDELYFSDDICKQIKNILSTDNNLIIILYHLDEINIEFIILPNIPKGIA